MKLIKYLIFVIIAIIVWYLVFEFKQSKPTVSINNSVPSEIKEPLTPQKIVTNKKKKVFDFTENALVKTISPETDSNLTYLQAYRNTVFFNKCYGIMNDINQNISPLIKFKKDAAIDFYDFSQEATKQATALQLQYFSDFAHRCQSFLTDDKETYMNAKHRIYNISKTINPVTEQEKNLASGLDLLNQRNDIQKLMNKTQSSYSKLDDEVLDNIKTEINKLSKSIREYKVNQDWQTNQQIQDIIKDLEGRRSELGLKIRNNRVFIVDNKEKKIIENLLTMHKAEMVEFLRQNNSPDILLLYSSYIFQPTRQVTDIIIEEMKHELNTYDTYLMLSLYDVGIKLAACSMNYPCDDQSGFILDYCIRGFSNMSNYPDACGKTLEDFYFNNYLSPNQFEDVSKYFNYILEHYAKK